MARFRFKFATLLRARKSREEEALRALGVAQRAYHAELARKRALLEALDQALNRREGLGRAPTPIQAFKIEQDFIMGTKQRLTRQDQAILRASRAVEKALRAFLHARRQARMLETLHDRHYREFRKELAKRERLAQDELTTMRFRLKAEEAA